MGNFGGAGGLGIGTVLVVLAISYFTGVNPSVLLGGAQILEGGSNRQSSYTQPARTCASR